MSNLKNYLFTSESVSEGHPDKVSDRISDMVVDGYLSRDPFSRVACETLTTTNKVVLAGEVRGPEIKLAKELSKRSTGRTMYILDEPTTGLHQHDIKKLLEILHTFVKLGNTVVVIEHNLDVIKTADYIVDMGPEGGVKGGNIIAEGKPEEIIKIKGSYTGEFLKSLL